MSLAVLPFDAIHRDAAIAFNGRMREGHAPSTFLLPERAHGVAHHGPVTVTHFLALDGHGQARGGMLCQEYPARLGDATERVLNVSAPLSEGIIEPAFTFVGPLLIKHALRLNPRAFVVGMGHVSNPLPRLLKAMGWHVASVPFYFRMLRGARCARHLGPLRATRTRRVAADLAALGGIASLAPIVAHRPSRATARLAARFESVAVDRWDARADAAWESFAGRVTFGVERTSKVLPFFYTMNGRGPRAWWVARDRAATGWFGLAITPMSGNPHFGSLTVATLTDCVGTPEAIAAGLLLATDVARDQGADILIANIQHAAVAYQCQQAGWRQGPSNFLLATSPALTKEVQADRTYLTRRDGDGLANLGFWSE